LGESSISDLTGHLVLEEKTPFEILSGNARISVHELFSSISAFDGLDGLQQIESAKGTLTLSDLNLTGTLLRPNTWRFKTSGQAKNVVLDLAAFPAPVKVSSGSFQAIPGQITLTDIQLETLTSFLKVAGVVNGSPEDLNKVDVTFQGTVGAEAIAWIYNLIEVPAELIIDPPVAISQAHVTWSKDGRTSVSGDLAMHEGPKVSIDMLLGPEGLIVNDLLVQDEKTEAVIALILKKREVHLDFTGQVHKTTMDALLAQNRILMGWVQGDFHADVYLDQPMHSKVQGEFQGEGLVYPLEPEAPLRIESVSLTANKGNLAVESASITWGDSHLSLDGNANFSQENVLLDMNLSADSIEWERLQALFDQQDERADPGEEGQGWTLPVRGMVRVRAERFTYDRFSWRPFHAQVSFVESGMDISLIEANLCGVSIPGAVKVTARELSLDLQPLAEAGKLEPTLFCFFGERVRLTGEFDFKGGIEAGSRLEELVENLTGGFEFQARDGYIYHLNLLSQIFSFLSVTEIFRGKLPDLGKEGLGYNALQVKGTLSGGTLTIEEPTIAGTTMNMACRGDIHLVHRKMDLVVLFAALKTPHAIVRKIPLVGGIIGTALSVPVRVKGDTASPKVIPLEPSAVGSGLLGIMKNMLTLPVKIVQPLDSE
jgi:hypothetical protein